MGVGVSNLMGAEWLDFVGGIKNSGVENAACSPQAGSKSVMARNIMPKKAVLDRVRLGLDFQLLDNLFGYGFFFNEFLIISNLNL